MKPLAAPSKLVTIQAARGIAALLVIVFHCSTAIFTHPAYWPRDPLRHLFRWGHLGVELFFAISGFIILQAHWRDVGHPEKLRSYLTKRALRIYPVYWIVLVALLPVYAVEPRFGEGRELAASTLVSSFALVHLGTDAVVLAVSWTLFFEIVFYAVFALLVVDARVGVGALVLWWGLAASSFLTGGVGLLGLYPLAPVTLLFGFGMVAAMLHRRELIRAPGSLALAGTVLFVADGLLEVYAPLFTTPAVSLLAGVAAAVALAGWAELERRGRVRVPAALALVGDASYSIYLVHLPVLSLAAKLVLAPALRVVPPILCELALVAIAVAAGLAFHLAVERPLLLLLSRGRTKVAPALVNPVAS